MGKPPARTGSCPAVRSADEVGDHLAEVCELLRLPAAQRPTEALHAVVALPETKPIHQLLVDGHGIAALVIASGLYRLLARKMRGYADAQARSLFRDLVDMPATVEISAIGVQVHFHRRAHLPIIIASGLLDVPVRIPWWNNLPLTMTAQG